jgi:acyl transferase domain-containing protein
VDTACSSALSALHGGAHAVAASESGTAVSLAVSLKLTPLPSLGGAAAGMLSVAGRCRTFDVLANGYVRSEAVGALVLCTGSTSDGFELRGRAVHQDGRSASLTAPNGSAQRTLLLAALGRAGLGPADNGSMEAHGTGTALGDPTEAGALAAVHRAVDRALPLIVGAAKASVGHAEAPSGQVGLMRVRQVLDGLSSAGNTQLRVLNPIVNERLGEGSRTFLLPTLATRSSAVSELQPHVGSVSSFGYSGTIAHAVMQGHSTRNAPTVPLVLTFTRHVFLWKEQAHPLAQRRSPSSDLSALFRSPAAGALHAVVADHVVQGRVIFPGTGYLELARAAASAAAASSGSALHGVFFLQPLAVETPGLFVECAVSGGRFDVRSGQAIDTTLSVDATVHCSGAVVLNDRTPQQQDYVAVRGRTCPHTAEAGALYDMFHSVGLEYGPGYRTLSHLWGGRDNAAAARLHVRTQLQGTQVHPADLDDALCLGALISGGDGSSETRLPFAVDDARLRGAASKLWAVRCMPTRPWPQPAAVD